MTLLDRVKARIPELEDDSQDDLLEELLITAQEMFVVLRYPVSSPPDGYSVPEKWHWWVVSAAVELYSKTGVEGQITHAENGISRVYDAGDLSKSLTQKVTPLVKVVNP